MKTIRVGGVPEHFNYPWHYGIAHNIFEQYGLRIDWSDVKGGSGAMCRMLDENELDVALVLTEGIVRNIHSGGNSRIIQQYVKSPLVWGVHTPIDKVFLPSDLSSIRFARSRFGSGSHLMAYVHAEQNGYKLTEENFVTIGNIDGAIESFKANQADILLWEKFMTQPYVDQGLAKRIDLCVSPWPCFVMVGSGEFIQNNPELLEPLCKAIIESSKQVTSLENTVDNISEMYALEYEQVKSWYSSVEWQTSPWISDKMLKNVSNTLNRIGLLQNEVLPSKELCAPETKIY